MRRDWLLSRNERTGESEEMEWDGKTRLGNDFTAEQNDTFDRTGIHPEGIDSSYFIQNGLATIRYTSFYLLHIHTIISYLIYLVVLNLA